tara:strand:+ start:2612 stop:3712 length:1101 start_codon:yes stop_codon:yes gene_type:complete
MRLLIILLSALFILNAEDLQVQDSLKKPPNPNNSISLNSKSKFPKSVIFIIADGTGIGQYTLSYYANENFPFRQFQHVGLVATHPDDKLKKVTDSASSGTALSTGQKTYNGAVSIDHGGSPIKTVLEIAKDYQMSTGVVATSNVTHATPASFLTHIDYSKKEAEIARQMAKSEVDIIFGGGAKYWSDDVLMDLEKHNGQYIVDLDDPYDPSRRLVGLFGADALEPHHEGRYPTTTDMAIKAIDVLDNNTEGFFLMIEESQIEWGGNSNNAEYIRGEMESLSDLVQMCLDYQREHPNVLVVLTSDHECGGVAVHDSDNGNLDIQFTSDYNSANFVPVWASGPGANFFDAMMDNTDIGNQLIKYVKNR